MATINSTLDDIMQLEPVSREMLIEILQKRQSEERREIARAAGQSIKEYHSGELFPLTVLEIIEKLNAL